MGGESHVIDRQVAQLVAEDAACISGVLDERHAEPAAVRRPWYAFLTTLHDAGVRLLHDLP